MSQSWYDAINVKSILSINYFNIIIIWKLQKTIAGLNLYLVAKLLSDFHHFLLFRILYRKQTKL